MKTQTHLLGGLLVAAISMAWSPGTPARADELAADLANASPEVAPCARAYDTITLGGLPARIPTPEARAARHAATSAYRVVELGGLTARVPDRGAPMALAEACPDPPAHAAGRTAGHAQSW